ncbi:outer dense fiber protein 2 isoform X2 [Numida meleagris]|uniref:outer dense fiber protein 2 isoform X2 n=1 Tax=Numida meleagris TaxID=8996 RepID=UPI000B3DA3A6|nr:outer dense fiber protein 2 isoform X2 [Numida meleagris]XP_021270002.1 outer dense fiber protein 2 isoform X2 [Numida meleagris]XP_021270003.1 outer dense fiber protein 2 isoform X2 [Numida meleagris]XP_021270004.1 outer dense fiber protein 2 isoform X2 [Numida meleagris]
MKNRSSSPPLHVHVDENTPVHVHIKKGQKTTPAKCQQKHKQKMKGNTVNVRRAVQVKSKAPWLPPGKTSVLDSTYKWEGPTHRLEITPPDSEKMMSVLRLSDLSTDEEDAVCSKINEYERKIDTLMNVVGTLKNEAKSQKQEQMTKRLLEEQKEELNEVTQELVETEHENTLLRRNIERMREEKDLTVLQKNYLQHEKECLMSKLSEAERDGAAAARQISALKHTIGRLNIEKHMSSSDINMLTRQKELLLQKLSTFEETNRTLRELLREQHERERDAQKILEKQSALLTMLADADAEKLELQMRLEEKEKEIDSLAIQIQEEKEQAKAASELSKSMESVRGHLQAQLRHKEAENNRLTTQIRNLELSEAQHKAEVECMREQLKEARQKADRDKDALKKALRAQKERAERSEEYAGQLAVQLAQKDSYVTEALSTLESWKSRYNKVVKDKNDLELEMVTLNSRIADLLEQQTTLEDRMREDRDALMDKLHQQTTENTSFKMENERLKASVIPMEEELNQAHIEVQQLKSSVRNYEGLIETYKSQVLKTRMEADDVAAKLEMCDKEKKALKDEMNKEIELARKQFQSQLAELEKLPEILRVTETQLAECQDQLQSYEKKNVDLSLMIADLRQRIELQGDKMEMTRERYQSAQEEKKQLTLKVEELERKLEATNAQNIEFLQVIAKREESIHQCQLRLEEKTRECSSLARQLEAAIEDAKRQVEQTRERATSRERAAQSKMLDLETQLSRTKTELNQLRRNKDDAERRYESRLQDLKDRLEQSESTNRSMQNYVQFLKSSYANVFGESALLGSPSRSRSSP